MCHGWEFRNRDEKAQTDEQPSFLNEESSTDTELLTDGGDENDEE
jgi:hypothetical protein